MDSLHACSGLYYYYRINVCLSLRPSSLLSHQGDIASGEQNLFSERTFGQYRSNFPPAFPTNPLETFIPSPGYWMTRSAGRYYINLNILGRPQGRTSFDPTRPTTFLTIQVSGTPTWASISIGLKPEMSGNRLETYTDPPKFVAKSHIYSVWGVGISSLGGPLSPYTSFPATQPTK